MWRSKPTTRRMLLALLVAAGLALGPSACGARQDRQPIVPQYAHPYNPPARYDARRYRVGYSYDYGYYPYRVYHYRYVPYWPYRFYFSYGYHYPYWPHYRHHYHYRH